MNVHLDFHSRGNGVQFRYSFFFVAFVSLRFFTLSCSAFLVDAVIAPLCVCVCVCVERRVANVSV